MDKISGICMRLEQLFMSRKWRFLGNGSRFDGSCLTLLDAPICRRAGFRTRSRHSKFISFWDGQNFWTLRTKQVDVGLTIFGPEATAIAEFTADFVPFPFIWSKTTQRSSSFSVNLKTIVIFSYISCIYNHNYSKLLLIFWWFSCLAPNLTIHGSFDHQSCHSAQPPSPFGSVPCETNGTEHRIHHSRISNRRLHCNIVATCSNLVFPPDLTTKPHGLSRFASNIEQLRMLLAGWIDIDSCNIVVPEGVYECKIRRSAMGIGASKRGGLWHVNPQCLNLVRPSKSPHL